MTTIYQGNIHEQKCWTQEIPTRKIFGPTKYAWEKILDLQQTHEKKFWIHETPTRKKIFKPRNAHFSTHKIPTKKNFDLPNTRDKKILTHETPTRRTFGPTKYTREKILDLRRHHNTRPWPFTMTRDPRCGTRSTEFSTLVSWKPLRNWGNTLTVLLLGTVP